MGLGGKVTSERKTAQLLDEGRRAKPKGLEDEILGGMEESVPADPVINTTQEQGPSPEPPQDIPAGGMAKDDVDQIVDNATDPEPPSEFDLPDRGGLTPEQYAEKAAGIKSDELEARTWERNVNLDYMDSVEDIGKALEVGATMIPTAARQSLEEVQARVDAGEAVEILKDVLTEKPAALSATQLLAGRQVLLTMSERVEKLAEKIVKGQASDEERLSFEKTSGQMVMIQEYMQGKIREAGRALNSMKIVAQTVNSGDVSQIASMAGSGMSRNAAGGDVASSGGPTMIMAQQILDLKAAGGTVGESIKEIQRVSKLRNFASALVNYRNAAILTGFKTQLVNFISNTNFGAISTMAVRPTQALIGLARSSITGNQDRVYMAEAVAEATAFMEGFGDAIRMAARVWKDGTFANGGEYASSFGARKIDETVDNAPLTGTALQQLIPGGEKLRLAGIPQTLDATQRVVESISYGLLTASDEFFKSMAYRKSLYGQATRQAYMEGVDVPADRANELLNNVTKEMHDQAIKYAEQQTFTNNEVTPILKMAADFIVKAGQAFPPMRIIIPFVRTPTAIFDRSIKLSPLAPIQKDFYDRVAKGGASADEALGEMAFGTALATMFYFMYQSGAIKGENLTTEDGTPIDPSGRLTGQGPGFDTARDRNQRRVLESTGWQGVSVRAGDSYVSIQRGMEPFSTPLIGMLNYMDKIAYAQDEAEAMDLFAGAALATAAHFKDNTYLQGLADINDLMSGRINYQSWAAQQGGSFIPSLLRDFRSLEKGATGKEETPYIPRSNNFWEMLNQEVAYRLPGTENRAIRRYWDGTPVIAGGGEALYMYNSVSPVRVSKVMGSEGRDWSYANDRLAANGVAVSEPTSEIGLESQTGIKVDLLELTGGTELFDKMLEIVGQARLEQVEALIEEPEFEKLTAGPGKMQAAYLEKALATGLKNGKARFIQWLMEQDLDPEVYGEEAQLLNPTNLQRLYKDQLKGKTTAEQEKMLGEQGMKNVSGRGELYVPQI